MKMISSDAMTEATRLTRSGRLAEATALLRGLAPADRAGPAPAGRLQPAVIDLVPQKSGERTAPAPEPSQRRRAEPAFEKGANGLRGLADRFDLPGLAGGIGNTRTAPQSLPPGARFDEHVHAGASGRRSYKLYVPAAAGARRALIVMLHGCTQDPDDFAAGTKMNRLAEEHGFLVAYPAQPQSANASKCWNWFNAGDQQRDGGEPALLAGITRDVIRDHDVDPDRVFIAGLSAGGAAAAIMGARYPDLYAAIGIHSGLACGAARDMPSAFTAMRQGGVAAPAVGAAGRPVRTIVFHGDRDTTVSPVNGDQVIAQFGASASLRRDVTSGRAPGGLAFTRTVQADGDGRPMLEQWLVHGAAHAWSGGSSSGSYTEPRGPDASREMVRFFLEG